MTVYADYSYYERAYLNGRAAAVPAEEFAFYAQKASACINQYTLDRIGAAVPEEVRLCCCELTELFYRSACSGTARGVASEKVGDWSVSYENAEAARQALPKEIKSVVSLWLAGTGLLYRGDRTC